MEGTIINNMKLKIAIPIVTTVCIILCFTGCGATEDKMTKFQNGVDELMQIQDEIDSCEEVLGNSLPIAEFNDAKNKLYEQYKLKVNLLNNEPFSDLVQFMDEDFINEYIETYSEKDLINCMVDLHNSVDTYIMSKDKYFKSESADRVSSASKEYGEKVEITTENVLQKLKINILSIDDFQSTPQEYYADNPQVAQSVGESLVKASLNKMQEDRDTIECNARLDSISYFGNFMCAVVRTERKYRYYSPGRYEWENGVFYDEPAINEIRSYEGTREYLYLKDKQLDSYSVKDRFFEYDGVAYKFADNGLVRVEIQ
jgi:hypothetical protein